MFFEDVHDDSMQNVGQRSSSQFENMSRRRSKAGRRSLSILSDGDEIECTGKLDESDATKINWTKLSELNRLVNEVKGEIDQCHEYFDNLKEEKNQWEHLFETLTLYLLSDDQSASIKHSKHTHHLIDNIPNYGEKVEIIHEEQRKYIRDIKGKIERENEAMEKLMEENAKLKIILNTLINGSL